ncbi:triphosphoribosyl-dephospho-CoA synthase [Bacillaceae bacterium C204]|uniref:triphosphoribosyl-dephospho-CoA synthase n=1 Tax=Neobacillus sp. 204 TaxID=3383351 RepID=UPI00397CC6A4
MNHIQTNIQDLGRLAVQSLIEEAELTPKPGLVDKENSGSHTDMSIDLMIRSAKALERTFREIAKASSNRKPSQKLREEIAAIGRQGEKDMFEATGGVNTHKGAIWALGLLVSSSAMNPEESSMDNIALSAGKLARFPDRNQPKVITNGAHVKVRYGVNGAKGEAQQGFPHLRNIALPVLYASRRSGVTENLCRLNVLIALMASLDDTCILHRGGLKALVSTKELANEILKSGGVWTVNGWKVLMQLDQLLRWTNASPGGSADLLAATLFLDSLHLYTRNQTYPQVTLAN